MGSTDECLTLRSGMLNLLLVDRLLGRVVATMSLSQVCWQVFSPGAEINQNSVMAAAQRFVHGSLLCKEVTDGDIREEHQYCYILTSFVFQITHVCGLL